MSALKVQQSAVPKMAADCYGSIAEIRRQVKPTLRAAAAIGNMNSSNVRRLSVRLSILER